MITTIDDVRKRLAICEPKLTCEPMRTRAAVALVLHQHADDLSLLLIRRAESEGDHWSGHIAFPGGRVDDADAGPRAAAEREVREEVGLRLGPGSYLGRLDDLEGRTRSLVVSGFVYGLPAEPALRLNAEVSEAVWLRLGELQDERRHLQRGFDYLGHVLELPAIRVLDAEEPVLWGLSYRFLEIFMRHCDREIPPMPWHDGL